MKIKLFSCVALMLSVGGTGLASNSPVTVSPGSTLGSTVGSNCPTFSWSAIEGARGYELIVYRVDTDDAEPQPVLEQRFVGSVFSWTPPLARCLERGSHYAWSVRALGRKELSNWSAPNLFDIASGPSEAEFESALAVVQQYLEERPSTPDRAPKTEHIPSPAGPLGPALVSTSDGVLGSDPDTTDLVPTTQAVPATVSFVTEGAIGVGTSSPQADLHVVGSPVVGSLLVAPSGAGSGNDSEIILAEDNQANWGMMIKYDGGANELQIWSRVLEEYSGPWLQIERDSGRLKSATWNPDPPCWNATERFVDCNNGTVTDTTTGLIFLKEANCFGQQNWPTAKQSAAALANGSCGLLDGSRAGDWRLPTEEEWERFVDDGCATAPKIEGNLGCYSQGGWASNVQSDEYWSATTYQFNYDLYDYARFTSLDDGATHNTKSKTSTAYVWPVRGPE